jgi:hypothetical protein
MAGAALLEKHVCRSASRRRRKLLRSPKKASKNPKAMRLRWPERNREFEGAASSANYGGRFDVSGIGSIRGPLYVYDQRSAHPASMPRLPCPLPTRWEHKPRACRLPEGDPYLAKISFSQPDGLCCGLPFRQKGCLFWPFQGTGWYWSPNIEAGRRYLRAEVVVGDLWVARRECNCRFSIWFATF